jgi:hypothetical protein
VFGGGRTVVGAAAFVAEIARNAHPRGTVSGANPGDRVGDFVEKDLVDLIVFGALT